MRVVVIGAGGKTGTLVVERALAKGYDVTALVHDANKVEGMGNARVLAGDATKAEDVRNALEDADAVIDTVGGSTPYKDTTLERTAVHNVVEGMRAKGTRRLVVVSMMGIGDSREQTPFWYEHLLMPTFLRGATKDKTAAEQEVNTSGLEFVIARPAFLNDDAAKGSVRVIEGEETGHKITRADLAQWLVDQVEGNAYVGQAVVLANS